MINLTNFIKENNNLAEALVSKSSNLKLPKEFSDKGGQGIADFDTLINQIKVFATSCEDRAIHNPDMGKFYRSLYKDFPQLHNYSFMKSSSSLRDYMVDNCEEFNIIPFVYFTYDELKRTGRDKKMAQEILNQFEKNKLSEDEARAQQNDVRVIRSADGDGDVYFYTGLTDHNVNQIKYAYTKLFDTDYFDTRPITFKKWDALDMKHKFAARKDK